MGGLADWASSGKHLMKENFIQKQRNMVSLSNPCLRWRLLVAQRSVSRARFPVVMQCSLLINSYVLRQAVFLMCYKPESPKAVLWQDVYIFLHGCFLVMPIYSYWFLHTHTHSFSTCGFGPGINNFWYYIFLTVEQEQIQKRTFTNWINAQLSKVNPRTTHNLR